jgi:hypothetical protein
MEKEGFSWGKVNGADHNFVARGSDSRLPRRESGQRAAKKGKLTKSSKEASSLYGSPGLAINNEERGLGVGHVDKLPWGHEGFVRSLISLNSFKGLVISEIEKTMQGTHGVIWERWVVKKMGLSRMWYDGRENSRGVPETTLEAMAHPIQGKTKKRELTGEVKVSGTT